MKAGVNLESVSIGFGGFYFFVTDFPETLRRQWYLGIFWMRNSYGELQGSHLPPPFVCYKYPRTLTCGVCMLEIWYGDIWPTNTDDFKKCRRYVLDYLILLKKENRTLQSLIQRCVSTEPKKRPLIKTVLSNLDRIHSTCIY